MPHPGHLNSLSGHATGNGTAATLNVICCPAFLLLERQRGSEGGRQSWFIDIDTHTHTHTLIHTLTQDAGQHSLYCNVSVRRHDWAFRERPLCVHKDKIPNFSTSAIPKQTLFSEVSREHKKINKTIILIPTVMWRAEGLWTQTTVKEEARSYVELKLYLNEKDDCVLSTPHIKVHNCSEEGKQRKMWGA